MYRCLVEQPVVFEVSNAPSLVSSLQPLMVGEGGFLVEMRQISKVIANVISIVSSASLGPCFEEFSETELDQSS